MANYEFRRFVNMMGFFASILIALASLIAMLVSVLQGNVVTLPGVEFNGVIGAIMAVANIIGYFVVLVAGFSYARSKRSIWYVVAQVISTLIIIAMIIVANVL